MFNSGIFIVGLVVISLVAVVVTLIDSIIRGKRALMDILRDEDYFE